MILGSAGSSEVLSVGIPSIEKIRKKHTSNATNRLKVSPGDVVLVHRFSGSSRKHGILRGGEFRPLFHLGENVFQNGAKGEISTPALGFDRAVFAPIPLPANSNCQRGQRLAIDRRELLGEIDAPPLQPADLGER